MRYDIRILINIDSDYGDCMCMTCKTERKKTLTMSVDELRNNKKFKFWYTYKSYAKIAYEMITSEHCEDCVHNRTAVDAFSGSELFNLIIFNVGKSVQFGLTEEFIMDKLSMHSSLLYNYMMNIDGKSTMCPFDVIRCTIDAGYFYGNRWTQPGLVELYEAKKVELAVDAGFDGQMLDMAKKATIKEACTKAWFNRALVPKTLTMYIPQVPLAEPLGAAGGAGAN